MDAQKFIDRWTASQASERANKDSFLKELCRVLGVPEPDVKTGNPLLDDYVFEADARVLSEDGAPRFGSMDLYRSGCFVLEAKQGSNRGSKKAGTAKRGTPGWAVAMADALGQALQYARTLESPPPFVLVADLGYCIDIYASFDGTTAYKPFPNAQKNRLYHRDLKQQLDLLRAIWLDPMSLDPGAHARRVTKDIASDLAQLAKELELSGHPQETVARFLMRCVFTMFAEDVGLLPDRVFSKYIDRVWSQDPSTFKDGVETLWNAMNAGTTFYVLGKLLRFNGGLFADPVALELNSDQIATLSRAANRDWTEVEPAIFGTLIERALDPVERHRLGAHFTPADYVRRLLAPTVEEPLRRDWDAVRVRVRELVPPGRIATKSNVQEARNCVELFLQRLCSITVLDPACGSGNFLYVALNTLKEIESEVRAVLDDLGEKQQLLGETLTVTPRQFLGIELRVGSKEIAELVLWIGYLQWHHRMYGGTKKPPEPVLSDYKNIVCGDALLENGVPRPWPRSDFIVGNPPYIANRNLRSELGQDYINGLKRAYPQVQGAVDYVMFFWSKSAHLIRNKRVRRAGLITTQAIRMQQNQRPVRDALADDVRLVFAIPDHPWTDTSKGAEVRVAMTVMAHAEDRTPARLVLTPLHDKVATGKHRSRHIDESELDVRLVPKIAADLSIDLATGDLRPLLASAGLSHAGTKPYSKGLVVTEEMAAGMMTPSQVRRFAPRYRNGHDIGQRSRNMRVLDLQGLSEGDLRRRLPKVYQYLLEHVYAERQKERNQRLRDEWWLFEASRPEMRASIEGLSKYIVTVESSPVRAFVFLESDILPDQKLRVIASDDPFVLGVLSSATHVSFARRYGGRQGVRNTPVYNTKCFTHFPMPDCKKEVRDRIASLAEELDAHRKRQMDAHPELRLTDMYKVLEKLRDGDQLTKKERHVHETGLIALLGKLHSELDDAVLEAYGWDRGMPEEEVIARLTRLNLERATEEESGLIRWTRPSYQHRLAEEPARPSSRAVAAHPDQMELPWPTELPEQVIAVRDALLATSGTLTANDVARTYRGASARGVVPALRTLEALGVAVSYQNGTVRWKGLAKAHGDGSRAEKAS